MMKIIWLLEMHISSKEEAKRMENMRGSRNFYERGSDENGNFWSKTRGKKSRNYLFLGKIFKFQEGGGSGPPVTPSGSAHGKKKQKKNKKKKKKKKNETNSYVRQAMFCLRVCQVVFPRVLRFSPHLPIDSSRYE